jgi:hypothetical protein
VLRSEGDFTTLGREIGRSSTTWKIEHERFEERLRVRIDVPQACSLRIPRWRAAAGGKRHQHGVARARPRRRRDRGRLDTVSGAGAARVGEEHMPLQAAAPATPAITSA